MGWWRLGKNVAVIWRTVSCMSCFGTKWNQMSGTDSIASLCGGAWLWCGKTQLVIVVEGGVSASGKHPALKTPSTLLVVLEMGIATDLAEFELFQQERCPPWWRENWLPSNCEIIAPCRNELKASPWFLLQGNCWSSKHDNGEGAKSLPVCIFEEVFWRESDSSTP